MATNDFIGFASNGSANIMSQADYAAAAEQGNGVQPGMASSALANKVWRQGANMASVIGELIKNHGIDALDNGDLVTLYNALLSATASTTLAGLMSAADKAALDNVPMTYLPATTISSGVWTPVLRGGTTAGVMTYTTQRGQYVKVGNLVFVWGEVDGTFTTLPAGEVQIAGLPFSAGTTRQCSINAYGRNGGVSNSVGRLVKAVAYLNYMILQANAAADTAANGVGKVDYATWDTSSNSGYKIYITSENNGARIYFAGVYSV